LTEKRRVEIYLNGFEKVSSTTTFKSQKVVFAYKTDRARMRERKRERD
jgi:hypothetical protein